MFLIKFYKNRKGEMPVYNLLVELRKKNNKDSTIKFKKINTYIGVLSKNGLNAGYPYIKKLHDDIWELRPLNYRILFFMHKNSFVVLRWFYKRTNKTPKHEIDMAIKEMNDYIEEVKKYE